MEKIRTVKQGDRVALECEAFGAPPPAVWWKRNGVVVKPPDSQMDVGNFLEEFVNAGLKTYEQGSTKSRLDISCFTAAQQGEYECVADNLQVSRANVSLKLGELDVK